MEEPVEPPKSRHEYARLYYHKNKEKIRARSDRRKEQRKVAQKLYYQANREKVKAANERYRKQNLDKRRERERRRRAECPEVAAAEKARHLKRYTTSRRYRLRVLATNAKNRAAMNGMAVEPACFEPILAAPPSHCACCCHELDYQNRRTPRSPSIDRIRNDLGYILGNVAIICFRCNSLKKNGSLIDFELILAYMRRSAN